MKRRAFLATVPAAGAALIAPRRLEAATPTTVRLPLVGATMQPSANLKLLVDQDCGFVNATASTDGRIFVAYQTRPDGNVTLTEDKGDYLAKIDIPPVNGPIIIQPQASDLPGPKQGSVSQLVIGSTLYVYYTGRAEGDLSGPFYVWRLTMPVPGKET